MRVPHVITECIELMTIRKLPRSYMQPSVIHLQACVVLCCVVLI